MNSISIRLGALVLGVVLALAAGIARPVSAQEEAADDTAEGTPPLDRDGADESALDRQDTDPDGGTAFPPPADRIAERRIVRESAEERPVPAPAPEQKEGLDRLPIEEVEEDACLGVCSLLTECELPHLAPDGQSYYEGCLIACRFGSFGASPEDLVHWSLESFDEQCETLKTNLAAVRAWK